jgi:beta-lactamase regulating signal transducer with metallopeptidase domain
MNWEILINSKLVENLGWTLVHSIWQIALIAVALFFVLRILRGFSANIRYIAAVSALALAAILPVFTFVQMTENSALEYFHTTKAKDVSAEQINKKISRPENLPDLANIEPTIVNENNKSIFAVIENSLRFFTENFAAVLPFIVAAWFFGIMFFAVRLMGGVWQLHVYKTRQITDPNAEWQERFLIVCEKLKIKQSVVFLQSNLIETPVAVGFWKPFILIPTSVFLQISPQQLETIIAHELIHIRRRDALVNFAQSIVEVLFFYHPCVWWMSATIRREREFAADESVVATMENSYVVYASALANLEEIRQTAKQQSLSPLATAANGGHLMQRITKILRKNTEIEKSSSAWSAGLALMLISAVLLTVFSFSSGVDVNAQTGTKNKKIAIGFVSIPPVDRTANPPKDSDATARLLIEKLKAHKIPAIGFVQGGMISDGEKLFPVRANIVRLWRDAGFEIGIGGFKHIWFNGNSVENYIANTEKNERVVRQILAEKNLPLLYFSYPFLNTGKSAGDREKFESWLASRGLSPVKYTIDNQEWMYSFAYDAARSDNDLNKMNEVRRDFLDYMAKMFDHYEAYSAELFGRDIAQTMVLTPSRLVADSADDLFGMIENRSYRFVSMDGALKDEAYQTTEAIIESKSGISWFARWQLAQGKRLIAPNRKSVNQ